MDYTIELPVIPLVAMGLGYPVQGLIEINKSSPIQLLDSLEQFAKYFKREQGYNFVQFDAKDINDPNSPFLGFLFAESGLNQMTEEHGNYTPSLLVGGGCFRYETLANNETRAKLDWIWLHPYNRNSGNLSRYWPQIKSLANDSKGFLLELPVSKPMRTFLKKKAHGDALDPIVAEYLDKIDE